uniref:Uncharacterized protein n=1 Tax=Eutreptiella gymnastica TaxID=73025 RepID=A0A7S4CJR6_9EUGL
MGARGRGHHGPRASYNLCPEPPYCMPLFQFPFVLLFCCFCGNLASIVQGNTVGRKGGLGKQGEAERHVIAQCAQAGKGAGKGDIHMSPSNNSQAVAPEQAGPTNCPSTADTRSKE